MPLSISLDDKSADLLKSLGDDFPELQEGDIIALGLTELKRKRILAERQAWADSLLTMELSEEEQNSLAEARAELASSPTKSMTAEELMASLLED